MKKLQEKCRLRLLYHIKTTLLSRRSHSREVTRSAWFSIITDEVTEDVRGTEQLNLAISWVSDHYKARDCSVVLFVFLTLNQKLYLVQ